MCVRIWVSCRKQEDELLTDGHLSLPPPYPLTSPLRFLKLYGRRFSKEDHILFIKLLYELVTLPNLEPHMMQSYARLLIQLLKWV